MVRLETVLQADSHPARQNGCILLLFALFAHTVLAVRGRLNLKIARAHLQSLQTYVLMVLSLFLHPLTGHLALLCTCSSQASRAIARAKSPLPSHEQHSLDSGQPSQRLQPVNLAEE